MRGIGRGSGGVSGQTNGLVGSSGSGSSGPKVKSSGGYPGGGRGGSKRTERKDSGGEGSGQKTRTVSDRTSGFHVNGKTNDEFGNAGPVDNKSGRSRGGRGRGGMMWVFLN